MAGPKPTVSVDDLTPQPGTLRAASEPPPPASQPAAASGAGWLHETIARYVLGHHANAQRCRLTWEVPDEGMNRLTINLGPDAIPAEFRPTDTMRRIIAVFRDLGADEKLSQSVVARITRLKHGSVKNPLSRLVKEEVLTEDNGYSRGPRFDEFADWEPPE